MAQKPRARQSASSSEQQQHSSSSSTAAAAAQQQQQQQQQQRFVCWRRSFTPTYLLTEGLSRVTPAHTRAHTRTHTQTLLACLPAFASMSPFFALLALLDSCVLTYLLTYCCPAVFFYSYS